jgi:succinylglutamic semialdehyde dehydrogenase
LFEPTPVDAAVTLTAQAFRRWVRTPFEERVRLLSKIDEEIRENAERFASAITLETGKTITEAREELLMVQEVFRQTFEDAEELHFHESRKLGPPEFEAEIRHTPRGPVAVIGPGNFPILMPLRAIIPFLLSGNTVAFKASPAASHTGKMLADLIGKMLPEGVLTLVIGGMDERVELSKDERIRSISFSGNLGAAREIIDAVAKDFSKILALDTGGKNAVILLEDGNPALAAKMAASASCSLTGQRNDSTSRSIVHHSKLDAFCTSLIEEMAQFQPGDPRVNSTTLGTLSNELTHKRYAEVLESKEGNWILQGDAMYQNEGRPGYYVKPAVRLWSSYEKGMLCPTMNSEVFAPLIEVFSAADDNEIIALNNATIYGHTASLFTSSRTRFEELCPELRVGNIYANLPTTASRTWLPTCGRRNSNNGKSFGRGFIRYTANELAIQAQGLS